MASFAIGAVQSVSSYAAKSADASAAQQYQAQERYNAEVARNNTFDQLQLRESQETDAASQALFDNSIRAVKARATADTGAAEAGVHGNSVESVARGFYTEQGRIDAATVRNNSMTVQQLREERKQADAQYRSQTNQPTVRGPSVIDLGLGIGAAGIDAYSKWDLRNKKPSER
jgi:hypothetical protein